MTKNPLSKLKKILLLAPISLLLFMTVPQAALAATSDCSQNPPGPFCSSTSTSNACTGIDVGNANPCQNDTSGTTIGHIINEIINIMSVVIGAIAVIMLIVAGFKFVTSGGSSEAISSAKSTIIYALVGLAVAALAQILIHFVLTSINK